jgi:glycogen phosphorylase
LGADGKFIVAEKRALKPVVEQNVHDETQFGLEFSPEGSGLLHYQIRIYPYHSLLTHPFETGCMLWV